MSDTMNIGDLQGYIQGISSLRHKYVDGTSQALELLFRGHSDVNYRLLPILARASYGVDRERDFVELAKCKYPDVFKDGMTPVQLLALLQHYGVPTRLLDVTESALVALYFACCSKPGIDGEVFVFRRENCGVDTAPVLNGIADTYRLTRGADYALHHFVDAFRGQPYFDEHRHVFTDSMFEHSEEFLGVKFDEKEDKIEQGKTIWLEKCCHNHGNPIFLYAPVYTLRQQLQRGRFILFPNKIKDRSGERAFVNEVEEIPKDHKCIVQRFIIKHDAKETILRDLELCGICEESLFFDSIDKTCGHLTKRAANMW